MILYRCFAWDKRAKTSEPDGPLWFPREFQGDGRHDNPDRFGCLYVAVEAISAVVEQLARFRTQRLVPGLLRRRGLPLALAEIELTDRAELVDLDDPRVLRRERLRPSQVATRRREVTQPQARRIHEQRPGASGLRWWSTFEASWMNVTLFERAAPLLNVRGLRALAVEDPAVLEAAQFLGMRVS
ncbi:MAG TPA: RES domain-containing protein [Vicinamibacterales bacterium]|nr:RES domain-containing protein [Vicinamibacterales bacterium]